MWGSTSTRRTGRWSAWTRSSKPWTALGRFYPCALARPSGAAMITCATAPRPSAALDARTGQVIGCHRRHRALEFRKFLGHRVRSARRVGRAPDCRQLRHPQDGAEELVRQAAPCFHIHFTPTSASWLNLVERWFGLLTEKQLRRGVHQSSAELEIAIYRYLDVTNEDPKPLVWTKTADQILASVARFCQRTLDTGH